MSLGYKTMKKPWIRLHVEVVDSAKVNSLSDSEFRCWINLLAISDAFGGIVPPVRQVAFRLHLSEAKTGKLMQSLASKGFIDNVNGSMKIHDYEDWQFQSDLSTERVRKFRAKGNVSETLHETVRNGKRNVLETEAETETETEREAVSSIQGDLPLALAAAANGNGHKPKAIVLPLIEGCEEWALALYRAHPKKKNRVLAEQSLAKLWASFTDPSKQSAEVTRTHSLWCATKAWTEKSGQYAPQLAEWIEDRGYESEPPEEVLF